MAIWLSYPSPGASPWMLDFTFSLLPCCVSCFCVSFSFLVFSSNSVLGSTLHCNNTYHTCVLFWTDLYYKKKFGQHGLKSSASHLHNYMSRKLIQDLRVTEKKPSLVNQQFIVYQFKCNFNSNIKVKSDINADTCFNRFMSISTQPSENTFNHFYFS